MSKHRKTFGILGLLLAAPILALVFAGCSGSSGPGPVLVTLNGADATGSLTVSSVGSTTLSGTAPGAAKVTVKIGSGVTQPADLVTATSVWQLLATLPNGANQVVVTAFDANGNQISAATFTVTNTLTPPAKPTAVITAPTAGQSIAALTGNFTVTGTAAATAPATVTAVKVRLNGGAWQTATGTAAWTLAVTLVAGSNTIDVQPFVGAVAGDIVSVTCTYVPPGPAPTVAITAPAEGATIATANPLAVTGTAAAGTPGGSALSKVQVRLNGGAFADATGTANWTANVNLVAGANTIDAKAIAVNGQESALATRHVTFNPPVPPPTISITAPAAGASVSGNVAVSASLTNIPAGVTGVNFMIGTTVFDTAGAVAAGAGPVVVNGQLDTLSNNLTGAVTITVTTTGVVGTASTNVTVNNGRSLYVQDITGHKGDTVTVEIKLNVFNDVSAVTATLKFDPTQLTVNNSGARAGSGAPDDPNATVSRQFLKNNPSPGVEKLVLVMPIRDAKSGGPETLSGSQVFTVPFTILGDIGTKATISFDTSSSSTTGLTNASNQPITPFAAVPGRVITN